MRRGFFAVGSPVDYRKGDPTGTVGTRLCPAKYSVLHRNNAVTQNRSFESPLRWQCSSAMKRADADTGARAVATASVVAVFFASPVSMNTTNRKGKTMYAILRFQKKTGGKLLNTQKHNERQKERYKSNPDIDRERSDENIHLKTPSPGGYKRAVLERTEKAGCRIRKDSVMMIETLITASPELFREMSREEMMDFMTRAYTFVAERVGEDNIVSAVIHLDEKTPHMHLCFVPLTKDHRLCAKEILGNRTHLSKYWQDGFFEYMHEQYPQLERGEPAAETKRKHIPVWLYKKGEHLDRMYGQVKEILDNIGILNAKGKSKEALELLRQWSKEGEYFSSKIKEVTGHIDGLNAEVNKWQSKYNSERRMVEQMSDYNKAANSTIEEQEYEIGRLIRQNDRYRELLDRIPDEIYEEITNTRSKNRDRGER